MRIQLQNLMSLISEITLTVLGHHIAELFRFWGVGALGFLVGILLLRVYVRLCSQFFEKGMEMRLIPFALKLHNIIERVCKAMLRSASGTENIVVTVYYNTLALIE
mgnify:CR=1 FL=1